MMGGVFASAVCSWEIWSQSGQSHYTRSFRASVCPDYTTEVSLTLCRAESSKANKVTTA